METSYVSSNFIRNKSSPSNISNDYTHYDISGANNPPATNVYVRLDKTKTHFVMNGRAHPRLVLTRGKKYQFNVVTPGKPFCLFTNVSGQSTAPVESRIFGITVDNTFPTEFYYGSPGLSEMTGEVICK